MGKHSNPYIGDAKTKQAKAAGFPARSVFKLEEIDRRCRLLHRGQRVLDLGAAPGSWSLFAAQKVGKEGLVIAVDIKPVPQVFAPEIQYFQADAFDVHEQQWSSFGPFDLVLSDMAPNTSGSKVRDQAQSYELFIRALEVAHQLSKPHSHFVAKLFMSESFPEAKMRVGKAYREVRVIRPEGTRQNSSELFVVGLSRL